MGPRPGQGEVLCNLSDLDDPGARGFVFGGEGARFSGFIVRRGGVVRGYVDACPHVGAPLALARDSFLTREGDLIICATHGALFRPQDGLCVAGPCVNRALQPWPVQVRDGKVWTA
jgi:nitrite reductase/ring-hydroxylating ferredoxin subunit